ncbi:preprotein translocase subunit SecY [bacterium]|nr:preprotein translocase subunit SecY [bacterium]
MFEKILNIFKIPDLRRRVMFTLGLLVVLQLGKFIPVPGVDVTRIFHPTDATTTNPLFGLVDLFTGGAFSMHSIFALGVMPYITASIILQLLTAVIPYLEQLSKQGEEGRKKMTQYSRYMTVGITFIQGAMFGYSTAFAANPVIMVGHWSFIFTCAVLMTTGTMFIMWMGEQITERGIGNGISLIIFVGIISRLPVTISGIVDQLDQGSINWMQILFLVGLFVLMVMAIVLLNEGQRRVAIKHGRRMVGSRMYEGRVHYLPIRINTAGVIPIIFASSILMFPAVILDFVRVSESNVFIDVLNYVKYMMSPGHPVHEVLYGALIVFFCYFYTAIMFNPKDVAENLQKHGVAIPGYSSGKRTEEYIQKILERVTLPGAVFLALVAIVPDVVIAQMPAFQMMQLSSFLGGTSLIIVVGVALDTVRQIENHLRMRNYEGFRTGTVLARRRRSTF